MQKMSLQGSCTLVLIVAGILASTPVLAEKPSWAGGEKGGKQEQKNRNDQHQKSEHGKKASRDQDQRGAGEQMHIGERQRAAASEYYAQQLRAGRCPPGLAKKRNGCMPPGQARKWQKGQPLPRDLIFYNLPPRLAERLGPPPEGHRFVRVASDILLIAVGTAMVVDAIEDLGKM
jgi:Ni/Co efflux regulator RcnB